MSKAAFNSLFMIEFMYANEVHHSMGIAFESAIDGGDADRDATTANYEENLCKTTEVRYTSIGSFEQEHLRRWATVCVYRPA